MKFKVLTCFLLSLLISTTAFASSLNGDYKGNPIVRVIVNGQEVHSEVPAMIQDGSTLLPLRAISEALGANVQWDPNTYTATISTQKKQVRLTPEQIKEISKSIALIYAVNADGQDYRQGTGFLIGKNILITNEHVAGSAASVRIELNGQTYTTSNFLFKNATTDVMGVKIDAVGGLTYSTDLPAVDAHVYAIGYPHGEYKLNEGKVLPGYPPVNGVEGIYNDAHTENGQSGGVLINDDGQVMGITSWSSNDFTIDMAVPMKYVKAELDKLH